MLLDNWKNALDKKQAQEEKLEEAPELELLEPELEHEEKEPGGPEHEEGPDEVMELVEDFVDTMMGEAGEYDTAGEDAGDIKEELLKNIIDAINDALDLKLKVKKEKKE